MKAYSQDLRERVLRAVDQGQPRSEIVNFFGVSQVTIKRYLKQRRSGFCATLPTKKWFPQRSPIRRIGTPGERSPLDGADKSRTGDIALVQASVQFSHSRLAQAPLA